jgi:hypothetical protein
MPIDVSCPHCATVLTAPDTFIGKHVRCPACRQQFGVSAGVAADGSVIGPDPVNAGKGPGAGALLPDDLPPPVGPRKSDAWPGPPPAGATPADAIQADLPPPVRPPAAPRRKSTRAKFIAADATTTQIEIGADGQLPQLTLAEVSDAEPKPQTQRFSSPLLLVLALAVSTMLSVAMLFWDTSSQRPEAESKADARQSLIDDYINSPPTLEPYKMLLRRALQAHSRGEYRTERQLYRQVLDMLHAEDKNRVGNRRGLTGLREERDNRPPNDQHLKEQLTILLRD